MAACTNTPCTSSSDHQKACWVFSFNTSVLVHAFYSRPLRFNHFESPELFMHATCQFLDCTCNSSLTALRASADSLPDPHCGVVGHNFACCCAFLCCLCQVLVLLWSHDLSLSYTSYTSVTQCHVRYWVSTSEFRQTHKQDFKKHCQCSNITVETLLRLLQPTLLRDSAALDNI